MAAFLAWFFTVGQAIAFIPLIARLSTGADLPTESFRLAPTFAGLVLPTLAITRIADDEEACGPWGEGRWRSGCP